ncbi:uncharacterized protein [Embiotoca jacksoni]|uniref:uncharacterized protein n=1 Tax=Embiotoca jacksoni TaxID=100190 RepID=UPI00370466CC
MTSMQLLRANTASRTALGYRVHHGAGASVHYSPASAAPAAPDRSRSFCLSTEKHSLQQLNGRLALYLQQVQRLEAANQMLERQIQEDLDRKCPGGLRELDGHLRTASLLQDKISECLSDEARVKLQLLGAELTAFDLDARCEKEREQRERVEAELSDLRLLEEDLKAHQLPELQNLLNDQSEQLLQLQIRHQQDVQVLLAQASGSVAVEMQTAESSDLIQQLDHLRWTSETLFDRYRNESWFNTQESMMRTPEVTFDLTVESEVNQAELEERRRTAASLTEELTQLQTLMEMLETSGRGQMDSFAGQLVVLHQTADGLYSDLDSVMQAVARQAADHENLLDVKSCLESEIQDYRRLLEGLSHQGVSSLHFNSKPAAMSVCVATSPSTFRRNITAGKTVRVQGGNLRTMEVQTVSRGHVHAVGQAPLVAPRSETVTTVQSCRVHRKQAKNLSIISVNTSNLTQSFQKSENQRTGALLEGTGRESTMVQRQRSSVDDGVHTKDSELQNSSIVGAQTKSETFTSKQASSQVTKTETNVQVEIANITPEPEVKQRPHFITHETTSDPVKLAAAEIKKETEAVILAQIDPTKGSVQAKNKHPAEVRFYELETPPEAVRDVAEEAQTSFGVSGSHVSRSTPAQGEVFDEVTLTDNEEEGVWRLDQSFALSEVSQDTHSGSGSPDRNDDLEIKTTSTEILKIEGEEVHDTNELKVESDNETVHLPGREVLLSTTESKLSTSSTDSGVGCSSFDLLSSEEVDLLTSPTKPVTYLDLEMCQSSLKSPNASEMYLSSNGSDTYLSAVEAETLMMNDKDEENKGNESEGTLPVPRLDRSLALSDESNSELSELKEDANSGSGTANASPGSPDGNDYLESKTSSTEILKQEVDEVEVVHDVNTLKVDHTESDEEIFDPKGQELLKMPPSLILKSSDPTEFLSPKEATVLTSPMTPVNSLSPEICQSPVETDMLISMTDHVFCPVDLEDHIRSPDLPLSPTYPEMYLSPNGSCLSPVEVKECPNGDEEGEEKQEEEEEEEEEENEEACPSLTEANAHVRPVEKYILSTKEEGQSLLFSSNRVFPEEGRSTKVIMSKRDGDYVRPLEANEARKVSLNGANTGSRPTGGLQVSSGHEGSKSGSPAGRSVIADREEQLGFGGLYCKSARDSRDRYETTSGIKDKKDFQTSGDRCDSGDKNQSASKDSDGIGWRSGDWRAVNKPGNRESMTAGTSGSTSGGEQAATAGVQGRFRRGSGDWMVYGSSSGRTSTSSPSAASKQNPSVATLPAAGQTETGRFGSGEWIVYGGSLRRKGSLDGGAKFSSEGNHESRSVDIKCATSPPESGRFGRRGSGEWRVYGGSVGGKSDSLPNRESKEYPSAAMNLPTSPPGSGRFSSRGSGEWRVYGGSAGRMSSASLPSAPRDQSPSLALQRTTSPAGGRFSSGGSGEWRVYGASSGRSSSGGSTERVLSPPGSYSSSGTRLSRAGSGGNLSSGSVVRRSSSVGSGGKLSSSGSGGMLSGSPGSHAMSRSGRYAGAGSGEWKPVYSSGSGRKSGTEGAGWQSGGKPTGGQRAPSPGMRVGVSGGSGGWLSNSAAGGNRISSAGSGSKVSGAGSSDRISGQAGGRISGSPGSGRTNSTGGRVISSSNRPIRSTGSGTGGNKERISVCKMAALSISAAGRERSQETRRSQKQQQQQQAAATSPLVQRWLTTGVGVTSAEPEALDDIMRL